MPHDYVVIGVDQHYVLHSLEQSGFRDLLAFYLGQDISSAGHEINCDERVLAREVVHLLLVSINGGTDYIHELRGVQTPEFSFLVVPLLDESVGGHNDQELASVQEVSVTIRMRRVEIDRVEARLTHRESSRLERCMAYEGRRSMFHLIHELQ